MSIQIAAAKLYVNGSSNQKKITRNQIEKYCIYGDPSLLMFGGHRDDPIIQYGKESINLEENIIHNIDAFKDILLNNSCFAYAYDVNGKLIISDNSNNIISKLNTFPFGVYFVYLQGNNISKLYKLIINK